MTTIFNPHTEQAPIRTHETTAAIAPPSPASARSGRRATEASRRVRLAEVVLISSLPGTFLALLTVILVTS